MIIIQLQLSKTREMKQDALKKCFCLVRVFLVIACCLAFWELCLSMEDSWEGLVGWFVGC